MPSTNRTRTLTTAAAASLLALALTAACGAPTPPAGQNATLPAKAHPVLLVVVDGLRWDHVGAFGGGDGVATPNLDALAAESIRFDRAFAQAARFAPSLAAILSGLYPTTNGLLEPDDRLQDAAETLAEAFARAGLPTAAFVDAPLGDDDRGLGQGFARYEAGGESDRLAREWLAEHRDRSFLLLLAGWPVVDLAQLAADPTAPEGLSQGLSALLADHDAGQPAPLDEHDLDVLRSLYGGGVRALDERLGGLVAALGSLGLDRRATLVVVAGSGFALEEHGELGSTSVWAPVTRVPMMIRLPGGHRPTVVTQVVESAALMPTILDLCGLPTPAGVQARSLVPLLEGRGTPPYVAFGEVGGATPRRFAALDTYQLVVGDDASELFNLAVDPFGRDDLAPGDPRRVEVLTHHLEAWGKMVAAASLDPARRSDEALDDTTLDQLRSLGYVQ